MKYAFTSLGLVLAGLVTCWGQDAPYTTEILSQPYTALEEYSLLELELGWDDPEEILPVPFDMILWGDTCTFLSTANVGEMIFGSGNGNHLIAPVFSDICDVSPADSTGQDVSEIRYTTEGVAPDRIFKVEYHNVGFYPEVYNFEDTVIQATQRATYQVWLHETGTIVFHYGPSNITDPELVADEFISSAGLIGNFDYYSYSGTLLVAEGPADSTTFITSDNIYGWIYGGSEGWGLTWPSEGTGYVFNPVAPSGLAEPTTATALESFPNPAVDRLTVRLEAHSAQVGTWVDARGGQAGTVQLQPGSNSLDVSALVPGAYVLRLEDGTAVRVTVQR